MCHICNQDTRIKCYLLFILCTFAWFWWKWCFGFGVEYDQILRLVSLLMVDDGDFCRVVWGSRMFAETCSAADAHSRESFSHVQRRVRRHRTIFTEEQLDALEDLFRQNQYPDINTREQLAQQTHLREERVEVIHLCYTGFASHVSLHYLANSMF